MADLALDTVTGDLRIEDGNLFTVRDSDALRQQLQIRLQFFRGEWFLDTRAGVPYFQDILIKNPDLIAVRGIFREAIIETPGVLSLESFELDFDAGNRLLSLDFRVQTEDGLILDFSEEFVIG